MQNRPGRRYNIAVYIAAGLFFFAGCTQSKQAVNLYVDAVMLQEMDQTDEALEKLNTAVEINPKFSLAYSLLGDIYQGMDQYEQSAGAYEKATELNPWSFHDFFNLGRVRQILKEYALAVDRKSVV